MTRVFISYSRSDRRRNRRAVTDLVGALDAAGFTVWRDSELIGGQIWWNEILRQLRLADAVVAVVSPRWAKSPACRSEFDYATAVDRIVIPVQVDDLGPDDARWMVVPVQVGGHGGDHATDTLPLVEWTDYRKRSQEQLLKLVKAVNLAEARPLPDPLPEPPKAPPPPPRPRWWQRREIQLMIACAVLFVAALGSLTLWPDSNDHTEVTVPADRSWTDTGVDIDAGDIVEVTSSGAIVHDTDDPVTVGPDGDPRTALRIYNILADVNHAALIGYIGDDPEPFLVGVSMRVATDRSGRLYLGINDAGVSNNTGSFTSVVTRVEP